MLSEIQQELQECQWDLLKHVNEDDPMAHCFPVWQRIYRIKYAIAKALAPDSILEIGVRYGYSAFAFLAAIPGCHYLGLDNDSSESGGVAGSLQWASQRLRSYSKASAIKSDTQKLTTLPGDIWDLVHVDGRQDGDSTIHDMNLAIQKARFILIDGYWWTGLNFNAINQWLFANKNSIEWHAVINDEVSAYGDVLIKVRRV